MEQRITINDVAERCGVSIATVSLVINNRPGVSQATRSRVLEIAQSLNYPLKNGVAKAAKLENLAMLVKSEPDMPPHANPFYSKVIMGIEEACRRNGINLLFATLPVNENNHPVDIPSLLTSNLPDGLLMVGTFVDETILSVTGRRKLPIVLVDAYSTGENFDAIVSDNFGASYQAVQYLLQKGHRHIAFAGGEMDSYPSLCDRRNGYLRALKEKEIPDVYTADYNIMKSKGEAEILRLLQDNPQITAIFGVNDNVAVSVLNLLQNQGRRVPEDISVIGYDDSVFATRCSPGLTTMHVDTETMGRAAVQIISMRLEHPESARMSLFIHPTLVERESVSSPRS